jgi:hypothetical protein
MNEETSVHDFWKNWENSVDFGSLKIIEYYKTKN